MVESQLTNDDAIEDFPTWSRDGRFIAYDSGKADAGFSVHDELELLVRAGLSPRDALMTETSNVADFLGETHDSGRIAVEKDADLLLLNANPLADIRNSRHIAGVMIGRYWIDRSGIEQILERLRKR